MASISIPRMRRVSSEPEKARVSSKQPKSWPFAENSQDFGCLLLTDKDYIILYRIIMSHCKDPYEPMCMGFTAVTKRSGIDGCR